MEIANKDAEEMKIQAMISSDPELKKIADEFDKEYEFRKKLLFTRKDE